MKGIIAICIFSVAYGKDKNCQAGDTKMSVTTSDKACCEAVEGLTITSSDMTDWCPWKGRIAAACLDGEADAMMAAEPQCKEYDPDLQGDARDLTTCAAYDGWQLSINCCTAITKFMEEYADISYGSINVMQPVCYSPSPF